MSNQKSPSVEPPAADDGPAVTAEPSVELTDADGHLDGLPDGAGCFEIWAHLSDARSRAQD